MANGHLLPLLRKEDATVTNDEIAGSELGVMLTAVRRDADQYFSMGTFRCKKTLANGAVVTVQIQMPSVPPSRTEGVDK